MNSFSLSELCSLFCLPPCPSSIAAKLAFLPPPPSYEMIPLTQLPGNGAIGLSTSLNEMTSSGVVTSQDSKSSAAAAKFESQQRYQIRLAVNQDQGVRHSRDRRRNVEPEAAHNNPQSQSLSATVVPRPDQAYQSVTAKQRCGDPMVNNGSVDPILTTTTATGACRLDSFYVTTRRRNQIVCARIRSGARRPYTILFSHGNAVDLGQMIVFLSRLAEYLGCDVFTYDYSGYGCSTGRPSEVNMYSDAEAAWNCLRNMCDVSSDQIIIYGQSIGTVATIELASKFKCGGVVLHSPMISGVRVACPGFTYIPWCCDVFQSTDKISRIQSLTLVIHGTQDEVIDISHGISIFDQLKYPADPLWVQGAGHNDIEMHRQYFDRLKRFVSNECPRHLNINETAANRNAQDENGSVCPG